MSTVIKVEDLSKQYRLGQVGTGSLAHDVNRWIHRIRGKEDPYLKIGEENDRTSKGISDYVWALKDINFEVKQGEVLGIIGRNGAGKSTLLKILSKTTTPTTGQVKIKGRIASLLEVGTGFHPELSGRENIFLNGAILGMTKQEIKSKFDEIVDFAGVERYIDTPVKRYSSGMYVRLAFGVAAHLEPEILIVDEVLAVGDAEFQKKALGKMKNVSEKDGRTVLFVSHNMGAIAQLCTKGMLMENGTVSHFGNINDTITQYLNNGNQESSYEAVNKVEQPVQILSVIMTDENGKRNNSFAHNEDIHVLTSIKNHSPEKGMRCAVTVWDNLEKLITVDRFDLEEQGDCINFKTVIPKNLLVPNSLKISVAVYIPQVKLVEAIPDFLSFDVVDVGMDEIKTGETHEGLIFSKMLTIRN